MLDFVLKVLCKMKHEQIVHEPKLHFQFFFPQALNILVYIFAEA